MAFYKHLGPIEFRTEGPTLDIFHSHHYWIIKPKNSYSKDEMEMMASYHNDLYGTEWVSEYHEEGEISCFLIEKSCCEWVALDHQISISIFCQILKALFKSLFHQSKTMLAIQEISHCSFFHLKNINHLAYFNLWDKKSCSGNPLERIRSFLIDFQHNQDPGVILLSHKINKCKEVQELEPEVVYFQKIYGLVRNQPCQKSSNEKKQTQNKQIIFRKKNRSYRRSSCTNFHHREDSIIVKKPNLQLTTSSKWLDNKQLKRTNSCSYCGSTSKAKNSFYAASSTVRNNRKNMFSIPQNKIKQSDRRNLKMTRVGTKLNQTECLYTKIHDDVKKNQLARNSVTRFRQNYALSNDTVNEILLNLQENSKKKNIEQSLKQKKIKKTIHIKYDNEQTLDSNLQEILINRQPCKGQLDYPKGKIPTTQQKIGKENSQLPEYEKIQKEKPPNLAETEEVQSLQYSEGELEEEKKKTVIPKTVRKKQSPTEIIEQSIQQKFNLDLEQLEFLGMFIVSTPKVLTSLKIQKVLWHVPCFLLYKQFYISRCHLTEKLMIKADQINSRRLKKMVEQLQKQNDLTKQALSKLLKAARKKVDKFGLDQRSEDEIKSSLNLDYSIPWHHKLDFLAGNYLITLEQIREQTPAILAYEVDFIDAFLIARLRSFNLEERKILDAKRQANLSHPDFLAYYKKRMSEACGLINRKKNKSK